MEGGSQQVPGPKQSVQQRNPNAHTGIAIQITAHTRYPEAYRLQCYRYSRRIYNLTTMMGCCGQHAVEEQGAPP
jgi:transposase